MMGHAKWIDISIPLSNGMIDWPDDPPFQRVSVREITGKGGVNLSQMSMGTHTGTHVDAPRHFVADGADVSQMVLDTMIGPATVIEIQDPYSITRDELVPHKLRRGERILFKTRNSSSQSEFRAFNRDFVFIEDGAADFLAERKVRMVGVDNLSVGAYKGNGAYVHRRLLKSGAWIVEGLDLSHAKAGKYYLICLPLRVEQGDGAPARAILKSLQ
jgi:arylformamidase